MTRTHVTVRGNLCADPVQRTSRDGGTTYTTFRVASTPWRVDRATGQVVSETSSFFNVTCFRSLGRNAVVSLRKGDPVVVTGTLSVNDWQNEERSGTSADVVASTVGHDLAMGIAAFRRAPRLAADLDEAQSRLDTDGEGAAGEPAGDGLDDLAEELDEVAERELAPSF